MCSFNFFTDEGDSSLFLKQKKESEMFRTGALASHVSILEILYLREQAVLILLHVTKEIIMNEGSQWIVYIGLALTTFGHDEVIFKKNLSKSHQVLPVAETISFS